MKQLKVYAIVLLLSVPLFAQNKKAPPKLVLGEIGDPITAVTKVLGRPHRIEKHGDLETYTYQVFQGSMQFVVDHGTIIETTYTAYDLIPMDATYKFVSFEFGLKAEGYVLLSDDQSWTRTVRMISKNASATMTSYVSGRLADMSTYTFTCICQKL